MVLLFQIACIKFSLESQKLFFGNKDDFEAISIEQLVFELCSQK